MAHPQLNDDKLVGILVEECSGISECTSISSYVEVVEKVQSNRSTDAQFEKLTSFMERYPDFIQQEGRNDETELLEFDRLCSEMNKIGPPVHSSFHWRKFLSDKTMRYENSEMTFISLNDDVLLHIFKFLNWIDSINLVTTCTRLKNLKYYWEDKRNQEFDLKEYVEKATVPIKNVLPVIGPYIRVAKITEQVITNSFMEICLNIKSLKIDECDSQNAAITLNKWMKQLKIESLSIGQLFETFVEELLDGIVGLKSFVYDSYEDLPSDFFDNNSAIQHLLLKLLEDYDLSPLRVLHSLQSLYLQSPALQDDGLLDDVQKYVKMNNLKEFSINCLEDNWDTDVWNNFAKYLATNTKLDRLRLIGYPYMDIDKETFSTLKLFNLTSLCLDVRFWNDFSTVLHENVAPRLKYLKLQWSLEWCCSEKIGHILKIWTNVEAICLQNIGYSTHQLQFNDAFYSDILEISDNRPGLRLHIFSSEICFNFISKRYNVIKGRKSCTCKDSFRLWDGVTCN